MFNDYPAEYWEILSDLLEEWEDVDVALMVGMVLADTFEEE